MACLQPAVTARFQHSQDDFLLQLEECMRREFLEYPYWPLSKDPRATRLLRLEPSSSGQQLRGTLQHYSLSNAKSEPYEALSYCWGSSDKPYTLLIGDGRLCLPITESLRAALLRLRRPTTPRLIWIDALCINQSEMDEKVRQILLMADIYSSASCVLCYLGEDSPNKDAAKALQLIHQIGRADFAQLKLNRVSAPFMRSQGLPPAGDSQWKSLLWVFNLPWYRRSWVVQEFVLAPKAKMICGLSERDWKDLASGTEKILENSLMDWGNMLPTLEGMIASISTASSRSSAYAACMQFRMMIEMKLNCNWADSFGNTLRSLVESDQLLLSRLDDKPWSDFPETRTLVQLLRSLPPDRARARLQEMMPYIQLIFEKMPVEAASGPKFPLPRLLAIFGHGLATDARDKVYALLSVSSDSTNPALKPNYNESVASVYTRYAREFITSDDRICAMGVLGNAGLAIRSPDTSLVLPSWVPDWSNNALVGAAASLGMGSMLENCFNACGDTKPALRQTSAVDKIIATGQLVGTIVEIIRAPLPDREDFVAALKAYFSKVDKLIANREEPYPFLAPGETHSDVQWRTLVSNLSTRTYQASASFGTNYLDLRRKLDALPPEDEGISLYGDGNVQQTNPWYARFVAMTQCACLCELSNGLVGLVPSMSKIGDKVYVFFGGALPFAVSNNESSQQEEQYQLIGGCYIHGIMHGEFLDVNKGKRDEVCLA